MAIALYMDVHIPQAIAVFQAVRYSLKPLARFGRGVWGEGYTA